MAQRKRFFLVSHGAIAANAVLWGSIGGVGIFAFGAFAARRRGPA